MESKTPRKTLAFIFIFFLLLVQSPKPSYSQSLRSNPTSSQSPKPSSQSNIDHKTQPHIRRILLGLLFGSLTGLFASIFFLLFIRLFLFFANRTPLLKGPVSFSTQIAPKTLQLALLNQPQSSQSLNSNPNANYFRLTLDNELVVAVKCLELYTPSTSPNQNPNSMRSNSAKRKMQRELELLARVKNRNVMSLRAYVREQDRLFLVYDYIASGSLEDAMKRVRSGQLSLGWDARHRIAVGIVKGLRYLHFECSPRILHHRLKPGNVILDVGFEPRLGDCGLGGLLPARVDALGCECYVAPECFQSCRAREALDKAILGEEIEEEEMLMAIRIALVCLSDLPADRPSSDELAAMLTQLHSF
ncbi:inactive leucine-rich repeat receptor-like protein kinase CORYNE [Asparagus officinalis]|uniref:inactive leucine-rich repeat receptor-like protein kinase CORYNE n=1 Tax=Asparagus officinalis TaxID=4686 RepID=UPI00098E35B6|nr:inactive leucine-rich repeat receptor-like protein kinase CORYNE [Asparagus officinalis]